MVLDPLFDYFVFLIYTDGYSNHYGCVCCTVLADNFGFRRRKALDFQTSVCQVTNKFLKLFFKKLDKSVFISFFHLPLTNTKIISPYRSPIHTPFEFPPYCGFSTITFRYMIKRLQLADLPTKSNFSCIL